MFSQLSPGLRAGQSEMVVLQSVNVEVVFHNLLCETVLTQTYQNLEKQVIEAVYTFPLPVRAALLGLKVVMGERELRGVVKAKALAEEEYEDALAEGNAAIMLEEADSGLYTMNVGNLLAGETIAVSVTYAELHDWRDDTLRYFLPTTIAPRYGDPEDAGLQPHQIPETSLLAENRFHIRLSLTGSLSDAAIESPSHQVTVAPSAAKTVVTLSAGVAFMDRDFVLNIRKTRESRDMVLMGRDLDNGYAVLASFIPSLPVSENPAPRSVKILVDCSGSMNGDAILQARQAVNDILQILRPSDYFNIFTFGNTCTAFFDRQMPADKDHITAIRRKLRALEADMGGTELALALQTAFASPGPSMPQDILLITDGEIWKGEEVIGMAKAAGHRVFLVGVGSSVSESFVRNLAHETGGACELVAPDENMAENIVRHFKRIYLNRVDNVTVRWPGNPKRITPKSPGPVFAGDTLHLFAFFADKPSGSVCLDMVLDDGQTISQSLILPNAALSVETAETGQTDIPDAVARCGIQTAIKEEPETIAADLALRYQLMSPHTRYIVVAERSEAEKEKGRKLPVLRKVPEMMAAGHAGMGSVVFENRVPGSASPPYFAAYIRSQKTSVSRTQKNGITPTQFVRRCNRLYKSTPWPVIKIRTYADLEHCGLPKPVLAALKTIPERHSKTVPEALYVVLFLHILMHSPMVPEFRFMLRLAIRRAFNMYHPDPALIQDMTDAFGGITMHEWGPEFTAEIKAEEEQDGDD